MKQELKTTEKYFMMTTPGREGPGRGLLNFMIKLSDSTLAEG